MLNIFFYKLTRVQHAFLCILVAYIFFIPQHAFAMWTHTPGSRITNSNTLVCPDGAEHTLPKGFTKPEGSCNLVIPKGNAVPVTGGYRVVLNLWVSKESGDSNASRYFSPIKTISSNQQLSDIVLDFSYDYSAYPGAPYDYGYSCITLEDSLGNKYSLNYMASACPGKTPLPPGPNFVSCAFNNGSALDVSLGEVDRSKLGTSPGTLPGIGKRFDVTCTGDGTVTYTVSFEYTPLTVGSSQLITSSASGVGIAMFLNDILVNTTENISRTYGVGTTTETLKFEPVRDPATQVKDIPTGAFTASAVMVLTVE